MTRVLAAELLKLRTTRTPWVLGLIAFGLTLALTALTVSLSSFSDTGTAGQDVLSNGLIASLLAMVLGVVTTAGEWRHGTITPSLLVTPSRARVLIAKTLALVIAGAALSLACVAAAAVVGLPWLSAKGVAANLDTLDVLRLVGGAALTGGLSAGLGVGVGGLLRNQAAGITVVLVAELAIEPALAALSGGVARFGPGGASGAASGADISDALPQGYGALVYLGYVIVLLGAAILVVERRDVT